MSLSSFPQRVVRAFAQRRRAFRVFDVTLEAEVVPDVDAHGTDTERAQITLQLRVEGRSVLIRVHAWPTHHVWIDARHSVRGGWRWEFTAEGRFLPAPGPRALVTRVERMVRAAHLPAAQVPEAMNAIWQRALVNGTRRCPMV
jgi:hypothetical protein